MISRKTYHKVMPSAVSTLSPFHLDYFITQVIRTEHIKQIFFYKKWDIPYPTSTDQNFFKSKTA